LFLRVPLTCFHSFSFFLSCCGFSLSPLHSTTLSLACTLSLLLSFSHTVSRSLIFSLRLFFSLTHTVCVSLSCAIFKWFDTHLFPNILNDM
jgi:hypothetical protein